jgi:hypothetical protein
MATAKKKLCAGKKSSRERNARNPLWGNRHSAQCTRKSERALSKCFKDCFEGRSFFVPFAEIFKKEATWMNDRVTTSLNLLIDLRLND